MSASSRLQTLPTGGAESEGVPPSNGLQIDAPGTARG